MGVCWNASFYHPDKDAFAELVVRHGSPVLGIWRRVLHKVQDDMDAFQATFHTLGRKAVTIRSPVAPAVTTLTTLVDVSDGECPWRQPYSCRSTRCRDENNDRSGKAIGLGLHLTYHVRGWAIMIDLAVDITPAPNASTQTHLGVSDRSVQRESTDRLRISPRREYHAPSSIEEPRRHFLKLSRRPVAPSVHRKEGGERAPGGIRSSDQMC